MGTHRRTRRITALVALSAAFAVSAIAPSFAMGQQNIVNDLLQGLGLGGQGGGAATPSGVEDPNKYQPPLHGTNPHGQGTATTVDLLPSGELPYSGDPAGGEGCPDPTDCEEVVIGRSRGEQNNPYHGHVTVLALFGTEIAGVDTAEGQSDEFNPLNSLLLDEICNESGGLLCLGIVNAESTTTPNRSQNHFSAVEFNSESRLGSLGITALESNGNIEQDQSCQTAEGNSTVTRISLGENGDFVSGAETRQLNGGLNGTLMGSSSESKACNNAPPTQTNDSGFLVFNGEEVFSECDDETLINLGLIAIGCNNDDTNGVNELVQQAPVPYGVREAFNLFVLPFFLFPELPNGGELSLRQLDQVPLALIKATTAASEGHAVAPPVPPTTPSTPSGTGAGGQAGQQGAPGAGPDDEGPRGPVAEEAGPGRGDLAFTGSDLLILGLIGVGLVIAGLTTTRLAVRHLRPTA